MTLGAALPSTAHSSATLFSGQAVPGLGAVAPRPQLVDHVVERAQPATPVKPHMTRVHRLA
ncbi:hypothetical protein BJY54_000281 [Streptomyces nodosus]|uniref:Uncharacterized protein n=1 Tax=Streptomyces nodosus TaxID=40318 RepID=A0A5P2VXV6_9ACTN|nr:hypothetical protein [Streptomyces nodosus]QEV37461.1 hypothetical protein CP978_01810 [Streptomyces nodosus]